jgi:hypothetical protein
MSRQGETLPVLRPPGTPANGQHTAQALRSRDRASPRVLGIG